MINLLKKFCRCGKIIPQEISMCSKCEAKFNNRQQKVYKDYKKRRVDFKEQKFYCSKEWKFTRDSVRQRDDGMCKLCDDNLSDVVHHIETLKDCWSKRLNMHNLICL